MVSTEHTMMLPSEMLQYALVERLNYDTQSIHHG
jgi:hypothetical protein